MLISRACEAPKTSDAAHAPMGVQLPKIIAASEMKPRPLVSRGSKDGTDSMVKYAPASPANIPPMMTLA